jgi:hypothetical protein
MFDFLDSFEKRMEWMGIANSIINRKGKNTELESLFDENELTNIIISVLLFIMEKTLEENNECEMVHIEAFLYDLTRLYYSKTFTRNQIKEIARYMIRDILQNNGVRYTYSLINYAKKSVDEITIRLISDKIVEENNERKIVYMLTNQGYEFLFRMREVDEEIQITMEQLKLKEYIKRKKFSSAVRQSVELITLIRQKKKELENLILSIRQNIHSVDVEQYEALIRSTWSVLAEEYETMREIQKMIHMAEEKIQEELPTGRDFDQKLAKAKSEIAEISHNIGVVITEQRDLIINRHNLTDLYMETIKKTFEFSFEKRYDFEQTLLVPLEKYSNTLDKCLNLLKPLFLPSWEKVLGIEDIYKPQMIYKETETQDSHMLDVEEFDRSQENERIKRISGRYVASVTLLFSEAMKTGETTLGEILQKLRQTDPSLYREVTIDRCLFMTALKLYDLGVIPVAEFYYNAKKVLLQPTDEFNIEYCLTKLKDLLDDAESIQEFKTEKVATEITAVMEKEEEGLKIIETIAMSDMTFKVVRTWNI